MFTGETMIAKGFTQPTQRVERLKKAIYDAVPVLEVERAVLLTKAYQEAEDLTPIMRRAKAMEMLLNNMHITIRDDELIVGSPTGPLLCQRGIQKDHPCHRPLLEGQNQQRLRPVPYVPGGHGRAGKRRVRLRQLHLFRRGPLRGQL